MRWGLRAGRTAFIMKMYDQTRIILTHSPAYFYKLRSQLGVKYFNKLLKFRTIYRLQPLYCSWIMYNITFLSGEGWIIPRLSSQKFSPYLPCEATKNVFDIQFRSDFITPAQTGLTAEKWYRWIFVGWGWHTIQHIMVITNIVRAAIINCLAYDWSI